MSHEKCVLIRTFRKSPWSMDANLMHISYEAGILEDPNISPPDRMWLMTTDPIKAPDQPQFIEIKFKAGLPVESKIGNEIIKGPLKIFEVSYSVIDPQGPSHIIYFRQ